MKKIALFFCLSFSAFTADAQWTTVFADSSKVLVDIAFPDALNGFVLGHNSDWTCFILKTSDGGQNWTELALPAGYYNQLAMSSATNGYIVQGGGSATLRHTTDGFLTSVSHAIDPSYSTMGLELLNDSSGFYMNNAGRLRSFSHYGNQFAILMDTLQGNENVSTSENTVYVANNYHLLKSTNGGAGWTCVNSTLGDAIYSGLSFSNADTGYYAGLNNGIWRTIDGGVSFQLVLASPSQTLASHDRFCAAVENNGLVAWSSDYGQNWVAENAGSDIIKTCIAPGGDCFVLAQQSGEIRKRSLPLVVPAFSAKDSFHVYPNPFNETLIVDPFSTENSGAWDLQLFNATGAQVCSMQRSGRATLSFEAIPAGIYFYIIRRGDQMLQTGKLVKVE